MKLLKAGILLLFISCNQNKNTPAPSTLKKDTTAIVTGLPAKKSSAAAETGLSQKVNDILQGSKEWKNWYVLNDQTARWISGQFEYFIQPKRKENPDYPYIAKGDFDNDKKPDVAALLTDSSRTNYQLVIISDIDSSRKLNFWKEDIIEDAAISAIPAGDITGTEKGKIKKIKLAAEAIQVEYFEKASFIIYRSGKVFKRIQQGD